VIAYYYQCGTSLSLPWGCVPGLICQYKSTPDLLLCLLDRIRPELDLWRRSNFHPFFSNAHVQACTDIGRCAKLADFPTTNAMILPIQGTNITLDEQEVLEAWIAERKRRWPSAARVEEKRREREDAVTRGQIFIDGPNRKRSRPDDSASKGNYQRGRGRGRGRGAHSGWNPSRKKPGSDNEENSSSSDSDDASPEVVSSKQPPQEIVPHPLKVNKPTKAPKEPRQPPQNPFASRPVLLRNVSAITYV
jgi:hypothetical protein